MVKFLDSTDNLFAKVSFSGLDKLYLLTIDWLSIPALSPKFPANLLTFSKYPPLASFEAALNPCAASIFPCKAIRGFFTSASLASVVLFKFTIFSWFFKKFIKESVNCFPLSSLEKTPEVFPIPPFLRKSLKFPSFKEDTSTFSLSNCPAKSAKNEVTALASLLALSNSEKSNTLLEIEASF